MNKVSVIMSSYNSSKFLFGAVQSLLEQSFSDFELILFDDASTDGSENIIKDFAKRDDRIKPYYNAQNLGLTKNLNKAIALSSGKYIARMDADDIALPKRLEKQVSFLDEHLNIDIVGSSALDINETGDKIQLRRSPEKHNAIISLLPKANPMTHSTVMFRKRSLEQIGFYNEAYRTTQDYEMWFRAAGHGMKFHNLSEVLLHYRMDKNYYKRKSFTYRCYDFKLRLEGFKHIQLPLYNYYYALIPIVLGLLPARIYDAIKKIDPRVKELH